MSERPLVAYIMRIAERLDEDDWLTLIEGLCDANHARVLARMVEGGQTEAEARELLEAQAVASEAAFDRFWDEATAIAEQVQHKHNTRRKLRLVPKE